MNLALPRLACRPRREPRSVAARPGKQRWASMGTRGAARGDRWGSGLVPPKKTGGRASWFLRKFVKGLPVFRVEVWLGFRDQRIE
jgi:hypothetical protein